MPDEVIATEASSSGVPATTAMSRVTESIMQLLTNSEEDLLDVLSDNPIDLYFELPSGVQIRAMVLEPYAAHLPEEHLKFTSAVLDLSKEKAMFTTDVEKLLKTYYPEKFKGFIQYPDMAIYLFDVLRLSFPHKLRSFVVSIITGSNTAPYYICQSILEIIHKEVSANSKPTFS